SRAQGSTTTPLPMTESLPGRTTPEGSRLSLKVVLPMTSVWPALCPPWNRTTTSARSESQSTIFPLPSSPHWAPTTATLAMLLLLDRQRAAGLEIMSAAEAPGFAANFGNGFESGDGDPALLAPAGRRAARRRRRQEQPAAGFGRRQGAQQRVEIEGETRRGLALGADIAPAAAELAAH